MAVDLQNGVSQDGMHSTQDGCGITMPGQGDGLGICAQKSQSTASYNGYWASQGRPCTSPATLKREGVEGNAYQAEPIPTGTLGENG